MKNHLARGYGKGPNARGRNGKGRSGSGRSGMITFREYVEFGAISLKIDILPVID